MGTFILKPTLVGQMDGFWYGYDGALVFSKLDTDLILGINNPALAAPLHVASALTVLGGEDSTHLAVSTSNDLIRFIFFGSCIYLDGSLVPTTFSALPAGFRFTSARVQVRSSLNGEDATRHIFLQFDEFTESGNLGVAAPSVPVPIFYDHPAPIPSPLSLINDGMGIRIDNTTAGQRSSREYLGGIVSGGYDLVGSSWDLTTPSPVKVGDPITVTGASGLDGVLDIVITYEDPETQELVEITIPKLSFQTQTSILLIFFIPTGLEGFSGPITVEADGDGVQFSGRVLLGTLFVLIENGSGIYRITSNKTNDTVYYNSPVNDDTVDVKIPNPFFKTGFVGG